MAFLKTTCLAAVVIVFGCGVWRPPTPRRRSTRRWSSATTAKPGTWTGWRFEGALKPFAPGVRSRLSAAVRLPRGSRFDLSAVGSCGVGRGACGGRRQDVPKRSEIMSGDASLFLGSAGISRSRPTRMARPGLLVAFATESGVVLRAFAPRFANRIESQPCSSEATRCRSPACRSRYPASGPVGTRACGRRQVPEGRQVDLPLPAPLRRAARGPALDEPLRCKRTRYGQRPSSSSSTSTTSRQSPSIRPWLRWTPTSRKPWRAMSRRLASLSVNSLPTILCRPALAARPRARLPAPPIPRPRARAHVDAPLCDARVARARAVGRQARPARHVAAARRGEQRAARARRASRRRRRPSAAPSRTSSGRRRSPRCRCPRSPRSRPPRQA